MEHVEEKVHKNKESEKLFFMTNIWEFLHNGKQKVGKRYISDIHHM